MSRNLATLTLLLAMLATPTLAQVPARPLPTRKAAQSQAASPTGVGSNPFVLIDYPGAIASQYPSGINDRGKIVGIAGFADGSFRGYLLQGNTFKDIVFPGAAATAAYGINKSGLVVGIFCDDLTCDTSHSFSLKGKTYTAFDFPGGLNTNAYAANAAGDIVGIYQTPDLVAHGFLLHKGAFTSIDGPGASLTYVFSINDHGTIAGIYGMPDGTSHGFTLQNGIFTNIDYPGATGTQPLGINNNGDIVGLLTDAQDNHNHGFLLVGGVFTVFDVPFPGSISTIPGGLNNNHQIVGSYGTYPPEAPEDYFFGFLTTY